MRNLKKILALVLALMMVVSVMVVASAASFNDYDDAGEIDSDYAEAVKVLTGMGVFRGFDGGFQPDTNVTRAEVATLVYRVLTGDVTDKNVDLYEDYDYFTDVNEANWFAGYVNYAANGKYVVGVGEDRYDPQGNVTGYQLLVIMLRAIGYGKNGEFEGTSQWTIRAATLANDLGITDGLKTTLGSELTREEVAYLLYNALGAQKVRYNGLTYRPISGSIGEDVFGLAEDDVANKWGQPSHVWYRENGKAAGYQDSETAYYQEAYEATASYYTAVSECDVYEDTGVSGEVAAYYNGNVGTVDISKTATRATIGAQGRQTYVYSNMKEFKDRVVFIDTFMAIVRNVEEAKFDANDHLAKPAEMTLTVYDAVGGHSLTLTNGATNYEYTVGTALLINAYTVDEDGDALVRTGNDKHVEIVDEAESFVGAQTRIHWNSDYHTVNGTDYMDAVKFFRDDAGVTEDYNFNWLLDQYGNIIGVTAITGNYAVLKDLVWINGTPGHAEATLVYMNGTEVDDVVINSIDGATGNNIDTHFGAWSVNDAAPALGSRTEVGFTTTRGNEAVVSDNTNYNGLYEGLALYRVDTNSDGSVNLEGIEGYPTDWRFEVYYVDDCSVNSNITAILDNGSVEVQLNNNTQFLVKTGDTYAAGTRADLPTINWETAEVFYTDVNDDGIAENVYVKSYSSITGSYIFVTEEGAHIDTETWGVTLEGAYIDGVQTDVATTIDIARELRRNPGKLYYITDWVVDHDTPAYGMLNGIALVNEGNDNDVQILSDRANYIEDTSNLLYDGDVLHVIGEYSYDVADSAIVIYDDEAYEVSLSDLMDDISAGKYGVWVVGNRNTDASVVYVGERLEEVNTIDLDPETGLIVAEPDDDGDSDDNTWTVTIDDKNDDGELNVSVGLDLDATSEYATFYVQKAGAISGEWGDAETDVVLENVAAGETYNVWVYTECDGVCSDEMWTIEIEGWNIISDGVIKVTNNGGLAFGADETHDVYYDIEDAADHAKLLSVDQAESIRIYFDRNNLNSAGVKLDRFTSSTNVTLTGFADAAAANVNSTDNYVTVDVSEMTAEKTVCVIAWESYGETVYFAFMVEDN